MDRSDVKHAPGVLFSDGGCPLSYFCAALFSKLECEQTSERRA